MFVLPTREDCFALVILEAMCAGVPIVCSQYADGVYDLIENEKNGFIVDPFDAPNFAAYIEKILSDRELCEMMQIQSADKVEQFRFENIAKGYMEAIEECI